VGSMLVITRWVRDWSIGLFLAWLLKDILLAALTGAAEYAGRVTVTTEAMEVLSRVCSRVRG